MKWVFFCGKKRKLTQRKYILLQKKKNAEEVQEAGERAVRLCRKGQFLALRNAAIAQDVHSVGKKVQTLYHSW